MTEIPDEAVTAALHGAIADPRTVTPRRRHENGGLEALYEWQARAVREAAEPLMAAAERQRCVNLARQVHATFTSSYSFTEGCTKTLPFADYLLAEDPPATAPGGTP